MEKQTLQAVNAHLDTTIGIIKCHSVQKKAVFPTISQHQPANKSLTKQRPLIVLLVLLNTVLLIVLLVILNTANTEYSTTDSTASNTEYSTTDSTTSNTEYS